MPVWDDQYYEDEPDGYGYDDDTPQDADDGPERFGDVCPKEQPDG
jgi:hypothetical protein